MGDRGLGDGVCGEGKLRTSEGERWGRLRALEDDRTGGRKNEVRVDRRRRRKGR